MTGGRSGGGRRGRTGDLRPEGVRVLRGPPDEGAGPASPVPRPRLGNRSKRVPCAASRGHHVLMRRRIPDADWLDAPDPVLALAQGELAFYERVRNSSRRWYRLTELGALATASSTVVAAGLGAPAWLTALIAGGALFFTGFRQVFGHGPRYVLAAQSHEALRRAVNRYRLLPAADRDEGARQELLATVERVGDDELRQWVEQRTQTSPPLGPPPGGPPLP
ncbi:SLATT domain-containing protein [Streptomyces viridosporus T7A]|uniref:SLATT domain-containing protein n=2 Tax=Streptomyces TaxID=1883 RepID=A0ABX6AFC1_STRVD|nr:SLATT domain-containing protein [Streptomyces viridosporus T7A]